MFCHWGSVASIYSFSQLNCFVLFCNDVLVSIRDLDKVPLPYYYICVTITQGAFYPTGHSSKSSSRWHLLSADCKINWTSQLRFTTSKRQKIGLNYPRVVCDCSHSLTYKRWVAKVEMVPGRWLENEGVIRTAAHSNQMQHFSQNKNQVVIILDLKDKHIWKKIHDNLVLLLLKAPGQLFTSDSAHRSSVHATSKKQRHVFQDCVPSLMYVTCYNLRHTETNTHLSQFKDTNNSGDDQQLPFV